MQIHHADLSDFVHSSPIITAVTEDYSNGQKSRHTPKITAFTVIVIV